MPSAGLVDPDDVPAVPDEPYVRAGDLYALGDHRLLCGDATNADDVARLLDGAHGTSRGREEAVHRAIRDVVLRIHLVIRIVDLTDAIMRREELVVALLTMQVSLTLAKEQEPGGSLPLVQLRDLLLAWVAELLAQEDARKVETRYLGGHSSPFPATDRRWQELVREAQRAAVLTLRLAELDGAEPIDEERQLVPDPERVEACIADFVEVARIKTLDDVGEGHAALARVRGWLASSAGPGSG